MTEIHQINRIDGSYPYFKLAHRVIYVTRGFPAEKNGTGISLSDWLETRDKIPEVSEDEHYEIRNPHTEVMEKIIQRGRGRILSSDVRPGWFSFMPRHISDKAGGKLPSIRLLGRFERIREEIGVNPSLHAWRRYVMSNRYLRLEEEAAWEGKTVSVPGRTVTLSKSGGIIVFRPSAVFIYFTPVPYESESPDPVFLQAAEKISKLLNADVNTKGFL